MEEQTADTAPWVDCKKYNAHKQGVDALWFHLQGLLGQAKLIYDEINQISDCISGMEWRTGRRLIWKGHEGTSWSEEMFYLKKRADTRYICQNSSTSNHKSYAFHYM